MKLPRAIKLPKRLRKRTRTRLFAVLAAAAFVVAMALFVRLLILAQPSSITISAGNAVGLAGLKWMSLDGVVPGGGLHARAVASEGSLHMLEEVDRGALDFAFIQGGFDIDKFHNVRQVTALSVIPLILMVKEELHGAVVADLGALRGKSVSLGNGKHRGVYWLSRELLEFAGLGPPDYLGLDIQNDELEAQTDRARLPDAIFMITRPPSRLVHHLAVDARYRFVPLPYGEAFRSYALENPAAIPADGMVVRKEHVADAVIPAFSYGVTPAIPPKDIPTVGSRLLLITHRSTRSATVIRVLETLYSSRWVKAIQPPIDKTLLQIPSEIALHEGAIEFRDREQPLITGESVGFISNALQILIPFGGGLLFLRGWLKNRKSTGRERSFDQFLALVSAVERHGSAMARGGSFDDETLHRLHRELSGIKESAFHYVEGHETSPEAFEAILLAYIADVRASLAEMHGRASRRGEPVGEQTSIAENAGEEMAS